MEKERALHLKIFFLLLAWLVGVSACASESPNHGGGWTVQPVLIIEVGDMEVTIAQGEDGRLQVVGVGVASTIVDLGVASIKAGVEMTRETAATESGHLYVLYQDPEGRVYRETYSIGPRSSDFRIKFSDSQRVEVIEKVGGNIIVAVKVASLPADGLDPAATVQRYWQLIGEKRFREAWNLLSQRFKDEHHDGDFEDYRRGWTSVYRCNVFAKDVHTVDHSANRAEVEATVVFLVGKQCERHVYSFRHHLIIENGHWVIDSVER